MFTLIKSSFLESKLTILRNKKTPNTLFRKTMDEISYLIAAEVLKYIPFDKTTVVTPLKSINEVTIFSKVLFLYSINFLNDFCL